MNIVMPMAGRGSRFTEAGYTVPKPLIDVRGKPMYAWATDSLPLNIATQLIFICLKEHLDDLALRKDIESRYAQHDPRIIEIDQVTQGQACTVLLAREWIANNTPLMIFNADTYCPTTMMDSLTKWGPRVDGALDVFEADGEKWSFARCDSDFKVLETAEKRRISPWATTGLYYFRHGSDFVRHADAMINEDDRTNNEFYIAPLYNRCVAEGADIRANVVSEVWVLGTPEDLAHFEASNPTTVCR
jgi:dTDP-glucose pyrophosphorylase